MISCHKENLVEDTEEIAITQETDFETVSIAESTAFFKELKNSKAFKEGNDIELNVDLSTIEQLPISDSEEQLNIITAQTKFKNVNSYVLQIKIDGELQTVLLNEVPTEKEAGDTADRSRRFTGHRVMTNLRGTVLNSYMYKGGNLLGEIRLRSYALPRSTCIGIACGIRLKEVVLTAPARTPKYAPPRPGIMGIHQFWRSNNNYSSMGQAYANYYRKKAQKAVYDKIDSDGLKGKERCVHELLNKYAKHETNSFLMELLEKFRGKSEFDIEIVSKNVVVNRDRNTGLVREVNGNTSLPLGSRTIKIEISSNQSRNKSTLDLARTIIHEYVHAEMFRKLNTSAPTSGDLDFRETYTRYKSGIFRASPQHNTMADLYLKEMAATLRSFHQQKLRADYNFLSDNGKISMDPLYDALAWQGLRNEGLETELWNTVPAGRKRVLEAALREHLPALTKRCPN